MFINKNQWLSRFKKSDIDIQLEDGNLLITGTIVTEDSEDKTEYLHKGIAERNFVRSLFFIRS